MFSKLRTMVEAIVRTPQDDELRIVLKGHPAAMWAAASPRAELPELHPAHHQASE